MKRFLASMRPSCSHRYECRPRARCAAQGATGATVLACRIISINTATAICAAQVRHQTWRCARLQSANNLKVDGLAGPNLAAMGIAGGIPSKRTSKLSWQRRLLRDATSAAAAALQLLPGYADACSAPLRSTPQALQQLNGLTVDGVCGSSTWSKLSPATGDLRRGDRR